MAYEYRIKQVTFSDKTTLNLPNLTVLVGPNNCGKSRVLKDIVRLTCSRDKKVAAAVHVLQTFPPNAKALNDVYGIRPSTDEGEHTAFHWLNTELKEEGYVRHGQYLKWPEDFDLAVKQPEEFQSNFAVQLTAFLTTESRLQLVAQCESAREAHQAQNLLQVLYAVGREKELEIRRIVSDAFPAIEIALDFSVPQQLQFRVGKNFDKLPLDPREARKILTKCDSLDEQGDGLRSYVGVVTCLLGLMRPVVLIDEPEAFLHPPQAFRLGQFIASQATQGRQIIVATHSADILRGIIFKANDALIARIDRIADKNAVKPLDPGELRTLVLDPLLSAAGVLNGLFYSGVVVTEADADSRFYQSLSNKASLGLDVHFVNADNKQTVPKVIAAYKSLGVRCAGVVDIDVLNNADEFNKQMEAAGITGAQLAEAQEARQKIDNEVRATPASVRLEMATKRISEMKGLADTALAGNLNAHEKGLEQLRRELEKLKADASDWQLIKKGGAAALKNTRAEFEKLYQMCSAVGLVINPCGELEASLSEYGVEWQADKRAWITRALQLVPNLEVNLERQPWKFVSDVHKHLQKPQAAAEKKVVEIGAKA
jgi:hypothetical protein